MMDRNPAGVMTVRLQTMRSAMNLWSVAALGIGSMVGAGIFALLGQAAVLVGRDVVLSFLLGGMIALLSGYSFARLAARYPGSGGIIDYLAEAFPRGMLAGMLSLVYLMTLVVTVGVVGKSFGAYAAQLFIGEKAGTGASNGFAVAVVLSIAAINLVGASTVGRAEIVLVVVKLSILLLLIAASLPGFNPELLTKGISVSATTLTASVGLTFFAYAGFGMMANAAGSVAEPEKVIPRAIFLAIIFVTFLYLALALVILGNLPADQLIRYADTAVAAAARPVLGQVGFTIVSIGGLLATASALNATLFSILNLGTDLAQRGKLPRFFARRFLSAPLGFLAAVFGALGLIVYFPLGAIANLAGLTFLISYIAVFAAHWRLRHAAGGAPVLIVAGAVLMLVVLLGSVIHLWSTLDRA